MPLLELSDGSRIAYEVEGGGSPVLLIQGVGVAGAGWQPQVRALCDRHRVASFDNRGLGASVPLVGAITIERLAGDALALMDALAFERAHVVGHSMGGVIAQELALRAPERVLSLSLLCTFARGKDAVALSPWIVWTGMRTRVGTRRMRRHAFLDMIMPAASLRSADRDALAAELAAIFGRDLADQPPVAMKQLSATGRHDASSRLAALASIPTLVVSGAHDRIAPPTTGRRLAELIPGARYVEIEDGAHAVVISGAERVNALLIEHLDAVERRRAA